MGAFFVWGGSPPTSYRFPREGGDPDPFTPAVRRDGIKNKALTQPSPTGRGLRKTIKPSPPWGRGLGEGVIHEPPPRWPQKRGPGGHVPPEGRGLGSRLRGEDGMWSLFAASDGAENMGTSPHDCVRPLGCFAALAMARVVFPLTAALPAKTGGWKTGSKPPTALRATSPRGGRLSALKSSPSGGSTGEAGVGGYNHSLTP
jgi:hypothetical protein